jgi:kynurenine 3-monooxygenase
VTLFMPYANFDALKSNGDVLAFFEKYFPDALELIGREEVCRQYFSNPTGALITVKVCACLPSNT